MMQVLRARRKGKVRAARHDCIGGLGEEERLLPVRVRSHLAGMVGIICPTQKIRRTGKRALLPRMAMDGATTIGSAGLLVITGGLSNLDGFL